MKAPTTDTRHPERSQSPTPQAHSLELLEGRQLLSVAAHNAPLAPRGMVVRNNPAYLANLQDSTDSTSNGEINEYNATSDKFLGKLLPITMPATL
jgi:hypothetical protein